MEEQHYQLLDGKAVSAQMKKEMAEEVAQIKAAGGKIPHLAAILVGHDGGSETYVASKVKTCQEIGFKSTLIRFEEDVTEEELLRKVDELNNDPDVDGFIVQLPLPKHISEQKVIEAIDYRKDVDGFHPINVGRMSIGLPCFVSATPAGILELLKRYHIETQGKHCVVLGRSNIVLDRDDIAVSGGCNEDVTLFHGLFHGRNLETFHSGLQGADRIDLGHEYTGPVRAHGVRAAFTYVTISGNDYHLAGDHYVRSPLDAVRQRLTATV